MRILCYFLNSHKAVIKLYKETKIETVESIDNYSCCNLNLNSKFQLDLSTENKLGRTDLVIYKIDTGNANSIKQFPRQISPSENELINNKVK